MSNDKKILIADDSEFMRNVLKDILKTSDYNNIIEADNGQTVIEKYKDESPDLILLDIIMPKVDGMSVLKEIGRKANILVISAMGQEKTIEEAKNLGAKGFVVKPFDREKVIEEVKKVLS